MEQKVDRHAADDGPPMLTTLDRPMEESGRVIGRMAFSSPQPQSHSDGRETVYAGSTSHSLGNPLVAHSGRGVVAIMGAIKFTKIREDSLGSDTGSKKAASTPSGSRSRTLARRPDHQGLDAQRQRGPRLQVQQLQAEGGWTVAVHMAKAGTATSIATGALGPTYGTTMAIPRVEKVWKGEGQDASEVPVTTTPSTAMAGSLRGWPYPMQHGNRRQQHA